MNFHTHHLYLITANILPYVLQLFKKSLTDKDLKNNTATIPESQSIKLSHVFISSNSQSMVNFFLILAKMSFYSCFM